MANAPEGNRLKKLREGKGFSRRDLAVALDLTEAGVQRLEDPSTDIPVKHVRKLAPLLGVTGDHLNGLDRLERLAS